MADGNDVLRTMNTISLTERTRLRALLEISFATNKVALDTSDAVFISFSIFTFPEGTDLLAITILRK